MKITNIPPVFFKLLERGVEQRVHTKEAIIDFTLSGPAYVDIIGYTRRGVKQGLRIEHTKISIDILEIEEDSFVYRSGILTNVSGHVVVIKENTQLKIYVNNQLVLQQTFDEWILDYKIQSEVSDIAIWPRTLDATETLVLLNALDKTPSVWEIVKLYWRDFCWQLEYFINKVIYRM